MSYVIREAQKLSYPIYVSTEDSEISQIATELGVEVINRPLKLAQDESKSIDAIKHAQKTMKADYVVLLNACCPFTLASDIQNCVDIIIREKCDSVISLVEDFSSHPSKLCNLIGDRVYPIQTGYAFQTGERQRLSRVWKRNTAIYVMKRSTIRKGNICGKKTYGYVMPQERSLDINTEFEWRLCELLLKN